MTTAAAAAPPAVLFDFDGTLADTAPDMVAALNVWLESSGRAPVALAEVRGLCSGGSRILLGHCGVAEEEFETAVPEYLQCYEDTGYRRTVFFDGIEEVLARLNAAAIPWGVATNKPKRYFAPIAERMLRPLGAAALVTGDSDNSKPKPYPDSLYEAARQCGAATAIYIGDDIRDGMAAQAAGMPFVGVTWGYWLEEQWQADNPPPIAARLANPSELAGALVTLGCEI